MTYHTEQYPTYRRSGCWVDAGFQPLAGFSGQKAFQQVARLQQGLPFYDHFTQTKPRSLGELPEIEDCTTSREVLLAYHDFVVRALSGLTLDSVFSEARYLPSREHLNRDPHVDTNGGVSAYKKIVLCAWPNPTLALPTGTKLPLGQEPLLENSQVTEAYQADIAVLETPVGNQPAVLSAKHSIHRFGPSNDSTNNPEAMRLLLRSAVFF